MRYILLVAVAGAALVKAQAPSTPATSIQHVVVIFQENISFDHYFATYPNAANSTDGEPVFTPAANTPSINGLTPALLSHNPNSVQPVRLPRRFIEDNGNLGRIGDQSFDDLADSLMGMFSFGEYGNASTLILDPDTGLPVQTESNLKRRRANRPN